MTIHARFLPKYPKRIQVTDGLTISEANGVVSLGFDYENSEFGAELAQAVATTNANATATASDRTAAAASAGESASSASEAAGYAADAAASAAANSGFRIFTNNKAVKDDTFMKYTGGAAVSAGDIVTTRLEGAVYIVAASGSTDHHVTTAGGVKLYDRGVYASPAVGQMQQVVNRLRNDLAVDIMVVSDSTGYGTDRWPHQLGILLAPDWPTFTVRARHWNTATNNYDNPIVIQTGSGSGILTIWNYAISGSVAIRSLGADLLPALTPGVLSGRDPDLVFVNYGHNGGDDLERQLGMEAACVGTIGRLLPLTPIVVVGQNPTLVNDAMRNKVRAWQHLVSTAGLGFVNVFSFFEDYAVPTGTYYLDTVHPSPLGSKLWAYCIYRSFIYQSDAARSAGRPFYDRGTIVSFQSYDDLNTGVTSNVSKAKDTSAGTWETGAAGLKITGDGVSTGGFISWTLIDSENITPYRGRWVTATVFVKVPSGSSDGLGVVGLYDGVATQTTVPPADLGNRFVGTAISIKVDLAATFVRLDVYAAKGTATSESFWIDRFNIVDGPIPADPAVQLLTGGSIIQNGNGVAIRHPNGDMTCRKSLTTSSVAISTAWGSLFVSDDLTTGSWALPFVSIDHATIRNGSGAPTGILDFGALNTTFSPTFKLWAATNTSAATYPITIEGFGRWK